MKRNDRRHNPSIAIAIAAICIAQQAFGQGELVQQMRDFQYQQQARSRAQNALMNQSVMNQYDARCAQGVQWFQNGPMTEERMFMALEAMAPDQNMANAMRRMRMNGGIQQPMQTGGNSQRQQMMMQQQMRQMQQIRNQRQFMEFIKQLQQLQQMLELLKEQERRNRRQPRNIDNRTPKYA